eukprot:g17788.t1
MISFFESAITATLLKRKCSYKATGESKENKLSDLNSEYTTDTSDSEERFVCPQCGFSRRLVRYGQCGHSATTCDLDLPTYGR